MNQQELTDFISNYRPKPQLNIHINRFDIFSEYYSRSIEDTTDNFYITINLYSEYTTLRDFLTKRLPSLNTSNRIMTAEDTIIVNKHELVNIFNLLDKENVSYETKVVYYFNVSYNTFKKARDHFLKNFDIDLNSTFITPYQFKDSNSFCVIVSFQSRDLETRKLLRNMLQSYCDKIEYQQGFFYVINPGQNFMAKFNLIKHSLDVSVKNLSFGCTYLKRFES